MISRLGQVVYWAASMLAFGLFALSAWGWWYENDIRWMMLGITISAIIWLFGRAVLYVLAGR
ncbi:MAG TPA: hypothetical protein VNL39_14990 [Xanthobacteraceae bacterium]|nr:hypothetical protein [Xanthobacteraceae bacterium]